MSFGFSNQTDLDLETKQCREYLFSSTRLIAATASEKEIWISSKTFPTDKIVSIIVRPWPISWGPGPLSTNGAVVRNVDENVLLIVINAMNAKIFICIQCIQRKPVYISTRLVGDFCCLPVT